jgi:hypothetical protein
VKVVLDDDGLSDLAEEKCQRKKIANHRALILVANKRDHRTFKNRNLMFFLLFIFSCLFIFWNSYCRIVGPTNARPFEK